MKMFFNSDPVCRKILPYGLSSHKATAYWIRGRMLFVFARAVAASPVFISWPSSDAASMTGWFTALYTPTHLPFNLQNYLSPPLLLSLHFCPPHSISNHLHLLIQFSLTSVTPLSLSTRCLPQRTGLRCPFLSFLLSVSLSLGLTLSQSVKFWWEAILHCTVWSGVVE